MFIGEQATRKLQLRRSDTSHAAPLGLVELIDRATINISLLKELILAIARCFGCLAALLIQRQWGWGEGAPRSFFRSYPARRRQGVTSTSTTGGKARFRSSMRDVFRRILPMNLSQIVGVEVTRL